MEASSCSLYTLVPLRRPFHTITISSAALVQLLSCLSLLPLPLIVDAQYSNNPSTDWTPSDSFTLTLYENFTGCVGTPYFDLLNEQGMGLYGRFSDTMSSGHNRNSYNVYYSLYFVTPAEDICMKGDHGSSPPNIYYLSVVALNGNDRDPNKGQVIWTANPENPVTENACLNLSEGNLTLVDNFVSSPQVVWQISTGASNVSLALSFEGNLVFFSNFTMANPPYVPLWESFRYPTDTLMALQVLEKQSTLSVNSSDSGNYTLAFQNGSLVLYARIGPISDNDNVESPYGSDNDNVESPYGSPYWIWPNSMSSVPANDLSFAAFCWDSVNQLRLHVGSNRSSLDDSSMVSPEFCSTIPNNSDTTMELTGLKPSTKNATYATFLKLDTDGDLRAYTVDNTSQGSDASWRAFFNVFNSTPCNLPLYCGFYGMCDPQRADGSYCTCHWNDSKDNLNLRFLDESDPRAGCKLEDNEKNQSITWTNTCNDSIKFLTIENVHYFSLNFSKRDDEVNVKSIDDCREQCNKTCPCKAAFWNESGGACFLILGRLGTIQQRGTMTAFIKYVAVPAVQPPPSNNNWKVVASVLAATLLVLCLFLAYWRRRRIHKMTELQKQRSLLLSLVDCRDTERFTWKQMHEYTCGFSNLLGGGGFGRVFRGALPDGTAIAVKQLDEDGSLGQGDKEFISEISILSRIRHVHLVRLVGFCFEGNHKLLVYEYMQNGSLDAWIFKNHTSLVLHEARIEQDRHRNMREKDKGMKLLPWKMRFRIVLETAKGLVYLHEECDERFIHMDLKPQNILLGSDFHAKISDFGMSRKTGRDQTSVMTVMRGTPGYLAPEWLLESTITEKCDVYSYGIVLLEIVSGRKVKDLKAAKQKLSMRSLRESVMLDFLDESLKYGNSNSDDVNEKEAVRVVEVALMCVRRDPRKRPSMSRVALMLEGKEEVLLEEVDDFHDGQELELVLFPSAMDRSMRMQHEWMLDMSSSLWSMTDSASGSAINIWRISDENSYKKKYLNNMEHSRFQENVPLPLERDTPSGESDRLLQN